MNFIPLIIFVISNIHVASRKIVAIVKFINEFYHIMEVNILAVIATALFILIPTAFLIILYVKTESQGS